ncbi:Alpha/Beta hydrolase protein [Gorgonomyces haynaldii]|nr:Alpha/Beta hydrolase protein [Gorgonomyces haynaldii]
MFSTVEREKGFCERKGYKIYYEIHGEGPIKIVLLMGLMTSMYSWNPVVEHFAGYQKHKYSCLVLENRGYGYSTSGPWTRYTTKELAEDVRHVMLKINWTDERSMHLVGISMGGMIALELCLTSASLFKSLTLLATCAKHQHADVPLSRTLYNWLNTFRPHLTVDSKLRHLFSFLISDKKWLKEHDERYPKFKTNEDRLLSVTKERMQRVPRPGLPTMLGQILAVQTHNVSPLNLKRISKLIPDIVCVTGTLDQMVNPKCTEFLGQHLGCETIFLEGKGHGLPTEAEFEIKLILERNIKQGEQRWIKMLEFE